MSSGSQGNNASANNDIINIHGKVAEVWGDNQKGFGSGQDQINITGEVTGDVYGGGGNDTVHLQGDIVGGTIAGGGGTDTLDFGMSTADEAQFNQAKTVIAKGGAGSFDWNAPRRQLQLSSDDN